MALQTIKTGSSLRVTKDDGSHLSKIRVELYWDATGVKAPYDLDVAAIEVSGGVPSQSMGKGISEQRVCYFAQKSTPALVLDGDNRTGEGEGADETIKVDLSRVDDSTNMIPFIITIYDGIKKGQDFAQTKGAKAILVNDETNTPIAQVDLDHLPVGCTAALFVTLNRTLDGWNFTSVNQGFAGKQIGDFFSLMGF